MSLGYVYVLSNPSMPGVVKIGRSRHGASLRAKSLNNTSVPSPFVVEFEMLCVDAARAEERAHRYANKSRVAAKREFFELSVRDSVEHVINAAWVDWDGYGEQPHARYVPPPQDYPRIRTPEQIKASREWIVNLKAMLEDAE